MENKEIGALRLSNEEAKKITEECLLGALLRLVKKKPFSKISISELVSLAGVSRTAFYRHYSTIEDIIKLPFVEILDVLQKTISDKKYIANPLSWYEDLIVYLEDYKDVLETLFIITDGEFMKIEILDNMFISKNLGSDGEYDFACFQSALRSILSKWIGDGFIAEPRALAKKCFQAQESFNIVFRT